MRNDLFWKIQFFFANSSAVLNSIIVFAGTYMNLENLTMDCMEIHIDSYSVDARRQ
jgi:hypothetical protein